MARVWEHLAVADRCRTKQLRRARTAHSQLGRSALLADRSADPRVFRRELAHRHGVFRFKGTRRASPTSHTGGAAESGGPKDLGLIK
jgi:hypothetical protein